jgi:hypothetical protein
MSDAVVAGEIARGLGGRDQVVGRDRERRVRQRDLARLGARALEFGHRLAHAGEDLGLDALGDEVLAREPHHEPRRVAG